jgi:uncharacterized protein YqeY
MSLREQLNADMKEAMKAGDKRKVATLRLVNSAIKDKDINSRTEGHDSALTADSGIIDVMAKMVKQRQDSVTAFEQGGRPELAQAEREEIAIIQTYLPKQMSEDEARAAIQTIVNQIGANGIKDMGKVMAELKTRHSGQMDMAKAGALVKTILG